MHHKLTETLSKYQKIILVGGGTGGHVQPIVSVIQYLRESKNPISQESKFLWIGGANSQEETAARENHVQFITVPTLKLATTRSPKILLYPFVVIAGVLEARKILKKQYADMERDGGSGGETVGAQMNSVRGGAKRGGASFFPTEIFGTFGHKSTVQNDSEIAVFSKGGPGSVAIGIAAWTLGIPLYIHESDTIPGRSNRILGKIATKIFLGFDSAKKYFNPEKCETIGQILHPVFCDSHCEPAKQSRKIEIKKPLDRFVPRDGENQIYWKTDKKHVLVICGSQGARAIFEEILQNLEAILEKHEVILVLGKLNIDMRKDFENKGRTLNPESGNLHLIDWISQSDLASLIPEADIAITRGSATTIAELTAFNTPVSSNPRIKESNTPTLQHSNIHLIIIPLPHAADNHQYWNAKEYEKLGHILLEQKNIHLLIETLEKIGKNSQLGNI